MSGANHHDRYASVRGPAAPPVTRRRRDGTIPLNESIVSQRVPIREVVGPTKRGAFYAWCGSERCDHASDARLMRFVRTRADAERLLIDHIAARHGTGTDVPPTFNEVAS